jgi:hypothetical protein
VSDLGEHRGVRALGVAVVVVIAAVYGFLIWQSDRAEQGRDGWDTVAVGARCADSGAEERTFADRRVFCVAMPSENLLLWSTTPRDIGEFPDAWDREATWVPQEQRVQVHVCMAQTGNDDRACHAAIQWSEQEHPPVT